MTNKIKLFIGLLALITLFSVLSFFNSFRNSSPVTKMATIGSNYLSFTIDQDADSDGLTNREESYWNSNFQKSDTDGDGFLDGEEVISGHDPLIPGPNDLLDNDNLTDKLSKLTLSGLYEGSLKPGSPNYDKSLNDMTLAVMDDAFKNLNPDIDLTKIKTITSNKKNEEIYLREISGPFEDFLKTFGGETMSIQNYLGIIGNSGFDNTEIVSYFQAKEQSFQAIFNKSYSTSVPKNFITAHTYFLHLIKTLQIANNSIAHGSTDPIKASAGLNALGDALGNIPELIDSFTNRVESEKLDNPFFESLIQ